MDRAQAKSRRKATARAGRPPKELVADVDERIIGTARELFLERGLKGVSVEDIARRARASKGTIYARFPTKEALFTAIAMRNAANVREGFESNLPLGDGVDERLFNLASRILKHLLADDTVDFIRLAVSEVRSFPDLAKVGRMMRERGAHNARNVLEDIARSNEGGVYPAFAADRLAKTTQFFLDLIVGPLFMRAVFGEDLKFLRGQIKNHVKDGVSFFLAASRT